MKHHTPLSSKATAFVPGSLSSNATAFVPGCTEHTQYSFGAPTQFENANFFMNDMNTNFVGEFSDGVGKGDYNYYLGMTDMQSVKDFSGKSKGKDKGKGKSKEGVGKWKGWADGPHVHNSEGPGAHEPDQMLHSKRDTRDVVADERRGCNSGYRGGADSGVLAQQAEKTELEELLEEALAEVGGPLLLEDFNASTKQFLTELMLHDRANPGSHRSVEAIDFIFEHTRNKKRENLTKPAAYVFSLLQKFDATLVSEKTVDVVEQKGQERESKPRMTQREHRTQERDQKPRVTQDREQKTQERSNRLATMARVLQDNAKKEPG